MHPLTVDDRLLNLLVDGELDEPSRRALLERLDAEPGGWKRCALAFLADQCWREACRDWGAPDQRGVEKPPPQALVAGNHQRAFGPSNVSRFARRAALAASLLAAFTAGLAAGPWLARQNAENTGRAPAAPSVAVSGKAPQPPAGPSPALATSVTLVDLGNPMPSAYEVPLLAQPGAQPAWPEPGTDALPPYLVRQCSQQGFAVEQNHAVVSLALPDGQRVAIPVDEVKLHFVGKRTY